MNSIDIYMFCITHMLLLGYNVEVISIYVYTKMLSLCVDYETTKKDNSYINKKKEDTCFFTKFIIYINANCLNIVAY